MRTSCEWTAAGILCLATAGLWFLPTTGNHAAPAVTLGRTTVPACCVRTDPSKWTAEQVTALLDQPAHTTTAEWSDESVTR